MCVWGFVCGTVAIPIVQWDRNNVFIATGSDKLFHTAKFGHTYNSSILTFMCSKHF